MAKSRKKSRVSKGRLFSLRNYYLRVVVVITAIILLASFYVYQRVWVRNLVSEIESLEEQNEAGTKELLQLRQQWMAAASIASVEQRIKDLQLGLRPTLPDQNLVLRVLDDNNSGRYSGIVKALEKIKTHIPVVAPSNADAEELFEDK